MTHQRNLSESVKKRVAGKQRYRCANKPGVQIKGIENYSCPLWNTTNEDRGMFDESGYQIDHIDEFSISHNDMEDNLQALCLMCHSVKTKRFMNCRTKNNTDMKKFIFLRNYVTLNDYAESCEINMYTSDQETNILNLKIIYEPCESKCLKNSNTGSCYCGCYLLYIYMKLV